MFNVKFLDGLTGKVEVVAVKCKTSNLEAVCKAAHKLLHGRRKLTTYQLISVNDVTLPYDVALICW